ncbi:hypothetical protein ED236_11015 [Pseudomethylobacillus aquaticus]|uniref:Uncharacterized protein n=1 Tax=Pseudomethylobacillus aquaticus TaxID=2676064 RepID=A0A3N0UVB5_9PROT|nr:hypothetical protein [Pseudomethylobacillus aquaticus]ROH84452.1 hypothetical protein ED236_11015 [Pseudomethylobacillus aquaticus]
MKMTIICLLCIALCACGTLQNSMRNQFYKGYSVGKLDTNVSDYYKVCKTGTPEVDCKTEAVNKAMMQSIHLCTEHVSSIYGNEAAFNISTGTLAALTSGWAAISTGGQASTLSAISAFTSSGKSLVNETVYKNMITTAIATKISEVRATKGSALRQTLTTGQSSLSQLDYDLLDFHQSCSFMTGLELALKEGTETSPVSKLMQLEQRKLQLQNLLGVRESMDVNKKDQKLQDSLTNDLTQLDEQIKVLRAVVK